MSTSPPSGTGPGSERPVGAAPGPSRPARSGFWRGNRALFLVGLGAAAVAAGVTALLVSVFEHKQEARNPFFRVVTLTDDIDDPAVWGKNFPLQYDGYLRTVDMKRTRYGGSEAIPHTPTQADPRSIVAVSKLEEDPRLKTMWAGYAFSKDFREERGHAYMLIDQIYTERQKVVKQPGTCINCHASTYVGMKKLGNGDIMAGFAKLNQMPYPEARQHVDHPVSCIDCHDSQTLALRVTRPAFIEGIRRVKALDGIQNYDVNKMATRQEMRSYVCGQCHVEYHFKGPEKALTYPWDKGLRADQILTYYEESGFKDWTHADTGAPALKAQHPEFEMWNQGIHARSGVACADCHMPYQRVGGLKISDHHVRSPLLMVNAACQTCHRVSEEELRARAETIQARNFELRDHALNALMDLISGITSAKAAGVPDEQLEPARKFQRKAQFLADFVEAENSMGFHADQEAARVLALSIDYSRQGNLSLSDVWKARAGVPVEARPPADPTPEIRSGTPSGAAVGGAAEKAVAPPGAVNLVPDGGAAQATPAPGAAPPTPAQNPPKPAPLKGPPNPPPGPATPKPATQGATPGTTGQ